MTFEYIGTQHEFPCRFCGETRSVKYLVKINLDKSFGEPGYVKVYACNKCVAHLIASDAMERRTSK